MHYPFCEGIENWELSFTAADKRGARFYYPNFEAYPGGRCGEELDEQGHVRESCDPVGRQIVSKVNRANRHVLARISHDLHEQKTENNHNQLIFHGSYRLFDQIALLQCVNRSDFPLKLLDGICIRTVRFQTETRDLPLYFAGAAREISGLDECIGLETRAVEEIVSSRQERAIWSFLD